MIDARAAPVNVGQLYTRLDCIHNRQLDLLQIDCRREEIVPRRTVILYRYIRRLGLASLVLSFPAFIALGAEISYTDIKVSTELTNDDDEVSFDMSGVSCLDPEDGKRVCLLIDDQGRYAQAATLEGSKLTSGGKIKLIGKDDPPEDIIGNPPAKHHCTKGAGKFKDLDGEAVARDQAYFYVVGSHGCGRNSNKFRTSSFILARIPHEAVRKAAGAGPETSLGGKTVDTSFRLSEALLLAPNANAFFARDLMTEKGGGLNIEGLAAVGGKLYAGLRGPANDRTAFLVEVAAGALFDANEQLALGENVREIKLDFLGGRGIRDLAAMSDGRLLILSGPVTVEEVPFALYAFDPNDRSSGLIAVLDDLPAGFKAEAVHVLEQTRTRLEVMLMFDGAAGGAPRAYRIELH